MISNCILVGEMMESDNTRFIGRIEKINDGQFAVMASFHWFVLEKLAKSNTIRVKSEKAPQNQSI